MKKKKKFLSLTLLLSMGISTFGSNVNVVFAQEPEDEIVLEGDESQTTEGSDENAEVELELEIPDSEEQSESISIDADESKSEIQETAEIVETESIDENEIESSNQRAFYSDSDFEIKDGVLVKYHGKAAAVNIPNSVKVIGERAFADNNYIKSVTFPSTVKEIGKYAFLNSGLVNVTIPDSVETIGESAFSFCTKLEKVIIAPGCTTIGSAAFNSCYNLKSITLPSTLKVIESYAFATCSSLKSIKLPESISEIQHMAFKNCKALETVQLPKNLKEIEYETFSITALKSITIPDKVTRIGSAAFSVNQTLTSVYLPYSITYLEDIPQSHSYIGPVFQHSPNVCLYLYSDHQYAIDYANKHDIPWKSRGLYNVQKPKTVKAESVGKNKVRLSWSKASGADKYLVQCWRNGKLQYKYTTKNNYLTDPKASDTASNTYKVYSRMTRDDGTVVYSSQPAVVSALGICPKVTNVRANSTTSGGQIKWNKSYYNDGYLIYRSVNKNGTGAVYAGTTRDVKFTDKKAKKGQLYYYWVYPYHYKDGKMILGEKPAESPRAKMK